MSRQETISGGYELFGKNRTDYNLVPLEASPSLPVIVQYRNSFYLSLIYCLGKRIEGNDKIQIYRPVSRILLDPITARIVYFIDYRFKDDFPDTGWQTPIGEFPHESIATLKLQQYLDRKRDLIREYDQAAAALKGGPAAAEWKTAFKDEFYALCPPCLISFLKKTGPSFFAWMDR